MSEQSRSETFSTIYPEVAREITKILIRWGRQNRQNYPWRDLGQSWYALIAEILLQRTRAKNVLPVFEKFIQEFSSPNALANSDLEKVSEIIKPLGLSWRAKYIQLLGKELDKRGGLVPLDIKELTSLPGVGSYSASAYLIFHCNTHGFIIDANIVRFICRISGNSYDGETRRKRWLIKTASELANTPDSKNYNYSILDFAMLVCVKRPHCEICPFNEKICLFMREKI